MQSNQSKVSPWGNSYSRASLHEIKRVVLQPIKRFFHYVSDMTSCKAGTMSLYAPYNGCLTSKEHCIFKFLKRGALLPLGPKLPFLCLLYF